MSFAKKGKVFDLEKKGIDQLHIEGVSGGFQFNRGSETTVVTEQSRTSHGAGEGGRKEEKKSLPY